MKIGSANGDSAGFAALPSANRASGSSPSWNGSGWGTGGQWRSRKGLARGGPAAVISTMGVFGFDPESREMQLRSLHPGVSREEIQEQTGWPISPSAPVTVTPEPTAEELLAIRRFDPERFWTGP